MTKVCQAKQKQKHGQTDDSKVYFLSAFKGNIKTADIISDEFLVKVSVDTRVYSYVQAYLCTHKIKIIFVSLNNQSHTDKIKIAPVALGNQRGSVGSLTPKLFSALTLIM